MTIEQFRLWFEGFTAATNGAPPDADQWATLCDTLAKIERQPSMADILYGRKGADDPKDGKVVWQD